MRHPQLVCGDAVCDIYPDIGGSIGCWSVDGQHMMRAANRRAVEAGAIFEMASFPLVPYSNRIGCGRFVWDGQAVTLTPNFPPEPHALHGVGWRRPWHVEALDQDRVTLRLDHLPDADWPWAFVARQQISLTRDSLTITGVALNTGDTVVPLAFGHHPYFDADDATLIFDAEQVWLAGADQLPSATAVPHGDLDFASGRPVAGRKVDNCYSGVGPVAKVVWANRPLSLEIHCPAQLGAAVVYVPEGGTAFCYEPVPHVSNALNMPRTRPAMPVVAPGESFVSTLIFKALAR